MVRVVLPLVAGMLAMGFSVAALFFVRFWRKTHDRLFILFALAFALLAVQQVAGVLAPHGTDASVWMYVLRLSAFLLILAAIVDKNRPGTASGTVGASRSDGA